MEEKTKHLRYLLCLGKTYLKVNKDINIYLKERLEEIVDLEVFHSFKDLIDDAIASLDRRNASISVHGLPEVGLRAAQELALYLPLFEQAFHQSRHYESDAICKELHLLNF